jgi:hypothetical protein
MDSAPTSNPVQQNHPLEHYNSRPRALSLSSLIVCWEAGARADETRFEYKGYL